MDLLAQVRSAVRTKALWQTVAFGIPFAIICYLGLTEFADTAHCFTDGLFIFGLAVFAVMIAEDWRDATVDVRLTAALLVFLLFASKQPVGNFLATGFAAFLFFRIVFVLSALVRLHGCSRKKEQCIIQIDGKAQMDEKYLAFLPSFGCALLVFSVAAILQNEPIALLREFHVTLDVIWTMLPTSLMVALLVILISIWLMVEALFHLLAKRFPKELEAGIGMGDVIVLPIFAAFLGLTAFTLVLFMSCFLHIGIFLCRRYIHWGV